jgi:hypothetical protein
MARQARLDVPLSNEQRQELDATASAAGLTPTAAARLAITQFVARRDLLLTGGAGGDLDAFIRELRADPRLAPAADQLAKAFEDLDVEADGNPNCAGMMALIEHVCRAPGSLLNRLRLLVELAEHEGVVTIPRALLTDRTHPKHGLIV